MAKERFDELEFSLFGREWQCGYPPITSNTTVRAFYTWNIPEDVRQQIEPGDYFDFKLPEELKPKQAQVGELKTKQAKFTPNIPLIKTEIFVLNLLKVKIKVIITAAFYFDTSSKGAY